MTTLGLSVIVKNEEERIPHLIKSIEGIFDEIIFIDTGSVDKTLKILKNLKLKAQVKVEQYPWVDSFAFSRNQAFSKVSTDLICWLDADDILPEPTRNFLKSLKEKKLCALPDGYLFDYQYCRGPDSRPYMITSRLSVMKRNIKPRWKYRVFEQLVTDRDDFFQAPSPIIHVSDKELSPEKKEKYNHLLKLMLDDGDDARLHALRYLAMGNYIEKSFESALMIFKELLSLQPSNEFAKVFILFISIKLGDFEAFKDKETFTGFFGKKLCDFHILLGCHYEVMEETEQAQKQYLLAQQSERFYLNQYWSFQEKNYWSKIWTAKRLVNIYKKAAMLDKAQEQRMFLINNADLQ